jgi:hypothetical protein
MSHEGNVIRAIRRVNKYPLWKSRLRGLEAMIVSRGPIETLSIEAPSFAAWNSTAAGFKPLRPPEFLISGESRDPWGESFRPCFPEDEDTIVRPQNFENP